MFQDNPQSQTEQPTVSQPTPETPQQPTSPTTPQIPTEKPIKTTQEERIWAAIGYVAFLGVVTMAMKPKSEFCRNHAAQGLILFGFWFVGLILLAIGSIFSAIGGLLMLLATALAVFGIIKAISSYELKVPVLSNIATKIPADLIVGKMTGKTPPPTEQSIPAGNQPMEQSMPQQPVETEFPTATEPTPPASTVQPQETPQAPPAPTVQPQETPQAPPAPTVQPQETPQAPAEPQTSPVENPAAPNEASTEPAKPAETEEPKQQ